MNVTLTKKVQGELLAGPLSWMVIDAAWYYFVCPKPPVHPLHLPNLSRRQTLPFELLETKFLTSIAALIFARPHRGKVKWTQRA
jgi:hypothetical protein